MGASARGFIAFVPAWVPDSGRILACRDAEAYRT